MSHIVIKFMILIIALYVINTNAGVQQCNLLAAGWKQVRFCPASDAWFKANDKLAGTDQYGTEGDTNLEWSINFEAAVPGYNMILFITGDGTQFTGLDAYQSAAGILTIPNIFGVPDSQYSISQSTSQWKDGRNTMYSIFWTITSPTYDANINFMWSSSKHIEMGSAQSKGYSPAVFDPNSLTVIYKEGSEVAISTDLLQIGGVSVYIKKGQVLGDKSLNWAEHVESTTGSIINQIEEHPNFDNTVNPIILDLQDSGTIHYDVFPEFSFSEPAYSACKMTAIFFPFDMTDKQYFSQPDCQRYSTCDKSECPIQLCQQKDSNYPNCVQNCNKRIGVKTDEKFENKFYQLAVIGAPGLQYPRDFSTAGKRYFTVACGVTSGTISVTWPLSPIKIRKSIPQATVACPNEIAYSGPDPNCYEIQTGKAQTIVKELDSEYAAYYLPIESNSINPEPPSASTYWTTPTAKCQISSIEIYKYDGTACTTQRFNSVIGFTETLSITSATSTTSVTDYFGRISQFYKLSLTDRNTPKTLSFCAKYIYEGVSYSHEESNLSFTVACDLASTSYAFNPATMVSKYYSLPIQTAAYTFGQWSNKATTKCNVIEYKIYSDAGTTTVSTDFENSSNIFSSLKDELLYLKPTDITKLATYTFYIVAKTSGGILSNKGTNMDCVDVTHSGSAIPIRCLAGAISPSSCNLIYGSGPCMQYNEVSQIYTQPGGIVPNQYSGPYELELTCGTWSVLPDDGTINEVQQYLTEAIDAGFEFPKITLTIAKQGAETTDQSGCIITKYQVFLEDCSTPSSDFLNADNLLTTLVNGKMKALVKDNVNFKTYNICIVATTESNYEFKTFDKLSFEIYCDATNEIIVGAGFLTDVSAVASTSLENGFYIFDPLNQITTSFIGCPIISYTISPTNNDVEMVKTNCSTNPCRDIRIKKYDVNKSPLSYNFKVNVAAQGTSKESVDQSVTVIFCLKISTNIIQSESMVKYVHSPPGFQAVYHIEGIISSQIKCPITRFDVYEETCSTLFAGNKLTQPTLTYPYVKIQDNITQKKYVFCIKATAEGQAERYFKNITYEVKCDETNEIVEPKEFKISTSIQVFNKATTPRWIFPEFTTTNVYCVITNYEIHQPNVTGIIIDAIQSRQIQVPNDLQTVNFTVKVSAQGGIQLISSIKEIVTWKDIIEYPVFPDPLDDWMIQLSSNASENKSIVEYKSIKALDYQGDTIISSLDFDGHKFLSGTSNNNNGTFTLYAITKKMQLFQDEFYVQIQLQDDKNHSSPISNHLKVQVLVSNATQQKYETQAVYTKNQTMKQNTPINLEKVFRENMAAHLSKPIFQRFEEAKQTALNHQRDQQLEQVGFEKYEGGITFPGVNVTLIIEALARRKQNEIFQFKEPKVNFKLMKTNARVEIQFTESIIVPEEINEDILDALFRVFVQSNNDDLIYAGSFSKTTNDRALQDSDEKRESDRFAFDPNLVSITPNLIVIDFNFINPKELSMDNQAQYTLEVKEPSILRDLKLFQPLSAESFKNNQPFVVGPVPALNYDEKVAKVTVESTKIASQTVTYLSVGVFVSSSLLVISMQSLWGLIRTLQVMLISSLVVFSKPNNLTNFLSVCVEFAGMDIFSAQDFFQDNFEFVETMPLNDAFDFYGIGNKNMLIQSGSYFVLQLIILLRVFLCYVLNLLAKRYARFYIFRLLGIKVYIKDPINKIKLSSQKILFESYFDMGLAVYLNVLAFFQHGGSFWDFFKGEANIINSLLTIFYALTMIPFAIYCHWMVQKHYKDIGFKHVRDRLEPFTDGCSIKTFHSAMSNVYFLNRRVLTVTQLIMLQRYASLQVTILTLFTLVNFIFTYVARPYLENNIVEILNETAILLCAYLMNTFLMCYDPNFSETVGQIFILICAQNILVSVFKMIFKLVTSILDGYHEKKEKKDKLKVYLMRDKNLLILENSDLSYLRELKAEQQVIQTVKKMKDIWPQHKWISDNDVDGSNYDVEIKFKELSVKIQADTKVLEALKFKKKKRYQQKLLEHKIKYKQHKNFKVVKFNNLKKAQRKFHDWMKGNTHLEFIDEMDSYEDSISMSREKDELQEVNQKEHKVFDFNRISQKGFQMEIKKAKEEGNQELIAALFQEMQGYGKLEMTDEEKIEQHKMLQRFISLDFMMEGEDEDELVLEELDKIEDELVLPPEGESDVKEEEKQEVEDEEIQQPLWQQFPVGLSLPKNRPPGIISINVEKELAAREKLKRKNLRRKQATAIPKQQDEEEKKVDVLDQQKEWVPRVYKTTALSRHLDNLRQQKEIQISEDRRIKLWLQNDVKRRSAQRLQEYQKSIKGLIPMETPDFQKMSLGDQNLIIEKQHAIEFARQYLIPQQK